MIQPWWTQHSMKWVTEVGIYNKNKILLAIHDHWLYLFSKLKDMFIYFPSLHVPKPISHKVVSPHCLVLWCICFQSDVGALALGTRSFPELAFKVFFLPPGSVAIISQATGRIFVFKKCIIFYPRWCYLCNQPLSHESYACKTVCKVLSWEAQAQWQSLRKQNKNCSKFSTYSQVSSY